MLFCLKSKFVLWIFLCRRLCCIIFLKQVNNSVNLEKSGRGFQLHIFKGISYKALKML